MFQVWSQNRNIGITPETVRNANFPDARRFTESKTLRVGPGCLCFNKPSRQGPHSLSCFSSVPHSRPPPSPQNTWPRSFLKVLPLSLPAPFFLNYFYGGVILATCHSTHPYANKTYPSTRDHEIHEKPVSPQSIKLC